MADPSLPIKLSFEICQSSNCDSLSFIETTGEYSPSNLTGWGYPNIGLNTATSAMLTITLANGNSYDIDLFLTGYFPTDSSNFEYELNNSDFGYLDGNKIEDQIITFTYTVIADGVTYVQTYKQSFFCQVRCCVLSMFADIDLDCDCSKDKIENAIKAYALLKGLIYSSNCGNTTYFNNILTQLQKLCLNNNCQNCK